VEYKISCIITARNEKDSILNATIQGLLDTTQEHNREIIVVDDGSDIPVVCSHQEVILHRNKKPVGVSKSRRQGSLIAKGDVLVWMDAHMSFKTDWLEKMLVHVPSGAMLCPVIYNYDYTSHPAYGSCLTWNSERNYHKKKHPGFGRQYIMKFPGCGAIDVPMVNPAFYMMLKESYWRTGGFSPLLRVWGGTEQDISIRAWVTGTGVKCVTNVEVGHLFRPKHPYSVSWNQLEYNQLAIIRSVFEKNTIKVLEESFKPLPEQVGKWFQEVDLSEWKKSFRVNKCLSDEEFFDQFVSDKHPL
jgi:polypeptide N-acetylgalactosaminyltransferase